MRIQTSKKKMTALNLNIYRNLHHRSNNALKVKFKELAEKRLEGIPQLGKIRLHYSICPKSKRRLDIGNVGSIVDKFFSDVLTESGIIEDDDFTRLDFVSFGFGGIAEHEHVLVTITEIEERTDMKLSMTAELSVEDVQAAVAAWVTAETGQETEAADVSITPDGGATVTVGSAPETAPNTKPKVKRRTKAQIEADNKAAKEAAQNDDTTVSDSSGSDSGGSSEESEDSSEAETSTSTKAEVKESKNDSEGSQGESSKGSDDDSAASEEAEAPKAPVKKPGKKSIFAQ